MKKELDDALCTTYPLIFKDRHADMRSTLMCWGFEVGDGWYDLLDSTCALIYWPYKQACQSYERARLMEGTLPYVGAHLVTAVSVERARLKMVEVAQKIPVAVQVKEKYGTLRFSVNGGTVQAASYINFAEFHSGKVCEKCGAPGEIRNSGWVRVLCDTHHEEREPKG